MEKALQIEEGFADTIEYTEIFAILCLWSESIYVVLCQDFKQIIYVGSLRKYTRAC